MKVVVQALSIASNRLGQALDWRYRGAKDPQMVGCMRVGGAMAFVTAVFGGIFGSMMV